MANADIKFRRFLGLALLVVLVVTCFGIWLYFDAQYKDATRELNEYRAQKAERQARQEQFLKFQYQHGSRP